MPEQALKVFLAEQLRASPEVKRLVLGFSGGLDSTVLLHALLEVAPCFQRPLLAVHVHHGLSLNADAWVAHVQTLCADRGVPLEIHRVGVAQQASLEAAAREARYAAFAASLSAGDALLLAQHQDDQAETLLFRLLRGAGVTGLGAMHAVSRFALAGDLSVPQWRPLLGLSRSALEQYATDNALSWVEDESNRDIRYARNFLRQEIFPRLRSQWPAATPTLAATALRLQEADGLLDELALEMAQTCIDDGWRLLIPAWRALTPARQRLLLRYWLQQQQLPMPGAQMLDKIGRELIAAGDDATPLLTWPGCEIRRYREHVYAMVPRPPVDREWQCEWDGRLPLTLPDGRVLQAEMNTANEKQPAFRVCYRRGGERLRPAGQTQSRALKTLLQEAGMPPWERERVPLVFAGDDLLAVAGLAVNTAAAAGIGLRLVLK
ncbi:MAG: tRNA lysidine(34) synthetase TilS [bacterium]|nr:tRNA lysidine(34) synthetase TilS [bacterium]